MVPDSREGTLQLSRYLVGRATTRPQSCITLSAKDAPPLTGDALQDKLWADLYREVPSAFWLDPHFWGPAPAPPLPTIPEIMAHYNAGAYDRHHSHTDLRNHAKVRYYRGIPVRSLRYDHRRDGYELELDGVAGYVFVYAVEVGHGFL